MGLSSVNVTKADRGLNCMGDFELGTETIYLQCFLKYSDITT